MDFLLISGERERERKKERKKNYSEKAVVVYFDQRLHAFTWSKTKKNT